MLHDSFIQKFEIDFTSEKLSIHYKNEMVNQSGIIEFSGLMAAKLDDICPNSIVLDIEEWEIKDFLNAERDYLNQRKNYAWSIEFNN